MWSIPSCSYTLSPFLQGSLSLEERDLMETSCLGPSVPRSLTLCIMSDCGSLYLSTSVAGVSFSDDSYSWYWCVSMSRMDHDNFFSTWINLQLETLILVNYPMEFYFPIMILSVIIQEMCPVEYLLSCHINLITSHLFFKNSLEEFSGHC